MVSSEIDDFRSEELGLNSTDPGKEDGPEFPSILRPSSSEPKLNNEKVSIALFFRVFDLYAS